MPPIPVSTFYFVLRIKPIHIHKLVVTNGHITACFASFKITSATIMCKFIQFQIFNQVALHEIGHTLGLPHTKDDLSVMNPIYRPDKRSKSIELAYVDRNLIQKIYGMPYLL